MFRLLVSFKPVPPMPENISLKENPDDFDALELRPPEATRPELGETARSCLSSRSMRSLGVRIEEFVVVSVLPPSSFCVTFVKSNLSDVEAVMVVLLNGFFDSTIGVFVWTIGLLGVVPVGCPIGVLFRVLGVLY